MPKSKNFKNACVYQLRCLNPEIKEIYIGSTTKISDRKSTHKCNCNNPKRTKHNLLVYKYIRKNGGFQNWTIDILEKCNVKDDIELRKRELYFFNKLKPKLNMFLPHYEGNNYDKYYRKLHKEKDHERYIKNKLNNPNQTKEYEKKRYESEKRKDYVKNKSKERYEKNKNVSMTCICGSKLRLLGLSRHKKTKIHRKNIIKIKKPLHIELLKLF